MQGTAQPSFICLECTDTLEEGVTAAKVLWLVRFTHVFPRLGLVGSVICHSH